LALRHGLSLKENSQPRERLANSSERYLIIEVGRRFRLLVTFQELALVREDSDVVAATEILAQYAFSGALDLLLGWCPQRSLKGSAAGL
jgi:hypothetical protein